MPRIIRSPEARADVDDIAWYIAQDNLDAALRFLDTIDDKLKLLASFPGAGTAREELAAGLRSLPVGNYLIFYKPSAKGGIEVVRVLHGARNLRRIFKRPKRK
jgi:toxin ParE1/3/4